MRLTRSSRWRIGAISREALPQEPRPDPRPARALRDAHDAAEATRAKRDAFAAEASQLLQEADDREKVARVREALDGEDPAALREAMAELSRANRSSPRTAKSGHDRS